ncbi:MAG: hypothetical protein LBD23_09850 [Oscillospiraceae bacterium]|jgi:hypothetical protein|nr:hypothetical protein [Oscillospiraceae bacterium]
MRVFILLIIIALFTGCINNNNTNEKMDEQHELSESTNTLNENLAHTQFKNTIVQNPVMNEITYEISEKLIGRYVVENDPEMYFEIKSNSELEVSLHTFSGYSKSTSESFYMVALYTDVITFISFQRNPGISSTFPGAYLAIDFEGDSDFTSFLSTTYLLNDYLRFVKVS